MTKTVLGAQRKGLEELKRIQKASSRKENDKRAGWIVKAE